MTHPWLALDIGGANLKAADGLGFAVSRPFALWRRRQELTGALIELLADCPAADRMAITMTGELADCFVTKAEGVGAILDSVAEAAAGRLVRVYLTDGSWASPSEAKANPILAAASNWHALARFAGRFVPHGPGILIDIGSTTCDITALDDGKVAAVGLTDPERLIARELVYTGVERSPLCAVIDCVWWPSRQTLCPVAEELFATTWDAYLLLGDLPEETDSTHTADGRPATRIHAHDRIARSICADRTMVSMEDAVAMAKSVADAQRGRVAGALERVLARLPARPAGIVVSGRGEFLARRVLDWMKIDATIVSLAEKLGTNGSRAATAHALAVLAAETQGGDLCSDG
jgi:(4-(4-[2-(gamma-L-glutamylamino)ethyl]phenoxymethyl)furan-2-yl)methanamine synthase